MQVRDNISTLVTGHVDGRESDKWDRLNITVPFGDTGTSKVLSYYTVTSTRNFKTHITSPYGRVERRGCPAIVECWQELAGLFLQDEEERV